MMRTVRPPRSIQRGGLPAAALLTTVILLTACSPAGTATSTKVTASDGSASTSETAAGEAPEFTGPWAADFAREYRRATSDFARAVLADGKITDQEFIEMRDRFTQCLSDLGYTEIDFRDDGAFSLTTPKGANDKAIDDQTLTCSDESGESTIGALRSSIRRNPDNQDEDTIMAACLVREGVVERGYSANDYAKDYADDTFPFLTGTPGEAALRTCNNDPLALHRDAPSRTKE